jgi:hypothetical protein
MSGPAEKAFSPDASPLKENLPATENGLMKGRRTGTLIEVTVERADG